MFQEYFEFYKTYSQKYGEKTAIFLMVGAFYELYEFQNVETGETRSNVKEIVDILGIQVSIKSNVEPGYDGLVAGFPDYVMHKWAGRLTSIGWTVVIIDQIKDVRGKVKERKVSRILSPSTHIENISSTETPYIATLYFQETTGAPSFGASILDLTTGTTHTYYGVANGRPDIWTADDIVQLLSVFQPKEVLIYWDGTVPDITVFRRIILSQIPIHIRPIEKNSFSKEMVRTEYLQKIYSIKSILPIRVYLGLRTYSEEMSLLFLLQFIEEHYPSMLKSFHRNVPWIPEERLICGNHALTQLQMTGMNSSETVIGLFDKSITSMGKRGIRDRLLSPSSNPEEIRSYLREVQEYMIWPNDKTKMLEKQLRFMCDLPRLHRKVLCGLVTPQEIVSLFQTYYAIQEIMKITKNTSLQDDFSEEFIQYLRVFTSNFNQEKAKLASNDITAFSEKYTEICEKEKEIQTVLDSFQSLKREIAINGGVSEDAIRLEEREKEPYGLKCSTVTLANLKKLALKSELKSELKISELKSGGWIDCLKLQQLNTKLQKLRESLNNLSKIYLVDACLEISETPIWSKIEKWVCHVDCTQCISRVSRERGFCCPKIETGEAGFNIKSIRHPLVEATSSRVEYVKHDISLDTDTKGWLVYGMNASGKSTLMKATGICILLAQAGCFVPAKDMTLRPFRSIYTRILNQDNIFAGLSSFAVEMSELRDILRNATSNTLVLGDELCAGTESISAQALVASGIQWLSSKNAKFIFATHLHDLTNMIDNTVKVWHLHVDYDPITKKLVYDRSLRPGSGSSQYGIEVARAMDLPFEFIEQALNNRHKIIGSSKQIDIYGSSWNKDVMKKECEVCHMQIINNLEVHHIKPRADAINGILDDGTHMNNERNLMVLCQKCHDNIHAGNLEIGAIKMTSDGPERGIIEVKDTKKHKSKWSDEEYKTIMDTLDKYSSLSLKAIRAHLSSKHEINISEGMLGKIRKK